MSIPTRVGGTVLLLVSLLTAAGCMRAELERAWRWPTSVVENAIWAVETAALETAKVIGGFAIAIVPFRLLGPFDGEGDDEGEDDGAASTGATSRTRRRPSAPPPSSSGRRGQGTRRQRQVAVAP